MCRCDQDECGTANADFIDSRIGTLVATQADPSPEAEVSNCER